MDTYDRLTTGSMTQEQGNTGSKVLDESNEHPDDGINHGYNELFSKIWREITSDNHLTLFGFRRYRTTHLLNLRFLEAEIDRLDHDLYQAGLQLNQPLVRQNTLDRLGLKQAKKDSKPMKVEEVVNEALIMRLRKLIKEYGECICDVILTVPTDWFR